jgi:hypothetical protein
VIQVFWDARLCYLTSSSQHLKGNKIFLNIGNLSPNNTASYPRKMESSATLVWEPNTCIDSTVISSLWGFLSVCWLYVPSVWQLKAMRLVIWKETCLKGPLSSSMLATPSVVCGAKHIHLAMFHCLTKCALCIWNCQGVLRFLLLSSVFIFSTTLLPACFFRSVDMSKGS